MKANTINILLADDDNDDCLFFKEALEELNINSILSVVNDGEMLLKWLNTESQKMPDILFLDLNMPRKNGLDSLSEIKLIEKFKSLPVIIYSTSLDPEIINLLYDKGANYYIRKPTQFSEIKKVIQHIVKLISSTNKLKHDRDDFVIHF